MSTPLPLTMTIMLGLPGAGKSTYVKQRFTNPEPKRLVICMDDLRLAFGYEYEEKLEPDVLELTCAMLHSAFAGGYNVVIDESVTHIITATRLVEVARMWNVTVEMIEVVTSSHVCWQRRKQSDFPMLSFQRKQAEWRSHKNTIRALTDRYAQHKGGSDS